MSEIEQQNTSLLGQQLNDQQQTSYYQVSQQIPGQAHVLQLSGNPFISLQNPTHPLQLSVNPFTSLQIKENSQYSITSYLKEKIMTVYNNLSWKKIILSIFVAAFFVGFSKNYLNMKWVRSCNNEKSVFTIFTMKRIFCTGTFYGITAILDIVTYPVDLFFGPKLYN